MSSAVCNVVLCVFAVMLLFSPHGIEGAETQCHDNALGAAEGGTLSSVDFTASSSLPDLPPSKGRLNGPLAWCSLGYTAGEEYLQIHVPKAESICAIAIQGTGYTYGNEYVIDYYVKHSEDGSLWQDIKEEPGKIKVFEGNKDSKSISKQVLPVAVEATYVRIFPLHFNMWICMRAELYGRAVETTTTEAPQITATDAPEITTAEAPEITTTEAPEITTTEAPEITTTEAPEISTTEAPEITTTEAPEITTTETPEISTTEAPEIITTEAPQISTTEATEITTTEAPEITTTEAAEISTTEAAEISTTEAPQISTTEAPEISTTEAPEITTTEAPEITTTEAPEITTTEAPEIATTEAPEITTTETPQISTTEAPEISTTEAPEITTTEAPEITTTEASEITTTEAPEITTTEDPNGAVTARVEEIKTTETPCQEKSLGAADGGTLSSADFTASSSFPDFAASDGRLNGPLAWCSLGFTAGEEYLQIHVPKAESICAIAIQGTGYTYGNEYVIDYYVKHSEDGSLWKNIEEEPGKMKVFEGNKDSKSISKQVLPVAVEATYVRIFPLQFNEWICMRAELYGREKTPRQPFPAVAEAESSMVTPPLPTKVVNRKCMDIGILIDSSSGVTADEFERLKSFISQLVISINKQFSNVHFGLIVYSDKPDLVMSLQKVDRIKVKSIIEGVKYISGGHRTDLAMLYASQKLFCPEGCEDRPEVENLLIVFTSEKTDAASLPYSLVSPIMKNCTSNIIAVGTSTDVSKSELIKIALGDPDRVLKNGSTEDLNSEVISKIEDIIKQPLSFYDLDSWLDEHM